MRSVFAAGLVLLASLACGGVDVADPPPQPGPPSASPPDGGGGGGGRSGKRGGGRKGGKRAGGGGGGGGGAPVPAPSGGGGGIYCEATGIYTVCTIQDGWQNCYDQLASGGGIGTSQQEAMSAAVIDCTTFMTNMIIIANMDGSGSVKQSCQPSACQ